MGQRPTLVNEKRIVRQLTSMEPLPFPLSSRAKPRDLQCGSSRNQSKGKTHSPLVIPTGANPDFLPRSAGHGRVCAFL